MPALTQMIVPLARFSGDWPGAAWTGAREWRLVTWSGARDPIEPPSTFRLLRDAGHLYLTAHVAFAQLNVDRTRPTDDKSHGLWGHDVVELFVSPNEAGAPYVEVEASPLGQWLDYRIEEPRVRIDREFRSGMRLSAELGETSFDVQIAVPFSSLGGPPQSGARWRANVYVAQGPAEDRRYLAWSPTRTPAPDFHVPSRFGWLLF